jgi:hypothetical protein
MKNLFYSFFAVLYLNFGYSQTTSHTWDVGQNQSLTVNSCTYSNCFNPSPLTTYTVSFSGQYEVFTSPFAGVYSGTQVFTATSGTESCGNLSITFDTCGSGSVNIVSWCGTRTYNFNISEPEPSSWSGSNVYQTPAPGCSGSSIDLYVSNVLPTPPAGSRAASSGQNYDTVWYTGSCGGTQVYTGGVYSISSPSDGAVYYVRLEPVGAGCGSNSGCKTITLNVTNVTAPTGTGDATTICSAGNYNLPTGSCSTGSLVWYDNAGGTGTTYSGTVNPTVSTTYYPFCEDGTCQSSAGPVAVVTVANLSAPTTANSSPSSVCVSGTVNLSGSGCGSGNILRWYTSSNGTTGLLQGGNPTPSATASVGNNTFYAFCYNSSSGCQSPTGNQVTVNINTPPDGPTSSGGNVNFCAGGNVTVTATCASGTVVWYAGGCGTAGIGSGSPFTFTGPGSTQSYYAKCYESSNPSGCQYSVDCDTVTVTPVSDPTSPTGINASVDSGCSGFTTSLSATCITGIVRWYSSPSGTGTGLSNPYTVNSSTTIYPRCYDSSYPSGCQYSAAGLGLDLTVLSNPSAPSAPSYSSVSCNDYNLVGSCVSGTIIWYDNSSMNGSALSNPVTVNQTTTYYAFCDAGSGVDSSCRYSAASSGVSIIPYIYVTGNGGDQPICLGDSLDLSSMRGCSNGTLVWYLNSAGTGTPYTVVSPTSTTVYYPFCEDLPCKSVAGNSISISVNPLPSPPTSLSASPSQVCNPGGSTTLSGNCSSGTLKWYNDADLTSLISGGSSPTVSVSSGNQTFYAVCENVVSCVSSIDSIFINLVDEPTKPSPINATVDSGCAGFVTTLSSTCATGVVRWYTSPTGTGIGESNPYTVNSSITLYARCYDSLNGSACQYSTDVISIDLNVLSNPSAPTGTSYSSVSCNDYNLIGSCSSGSIIWYDNSSMTGSPVTNSVTVNQATTYYAFCDAGSGIDSSCRYSVASPGVSIIPYIYVTGSGGDQSICLGDSLDLSSMRSCSNGTLMWYLNSAGTGTSYSVVSPTSTTIYYPFCEDLPCKSIAGNPLTITIDPLPPAPTGIGSSLPSVCTPGDVVKLLGSCSTGTLKWYRDVALTNLIPGGTNPNDSVKLGNQTFYAVCESASGCLGPIDSVFVPMFNPPSAPTAISATDTIGCPGYLTTLGALCSEGEIRWYTSASGTGVGESNPYTVNSSINLYARCYDSLRPAGCDYSSASSPVNLNVLVAPSMPTSISATPDSGCAPLNVTLSGNCSTGTIEWYTSSSGTGTGISPSQSVSLTTTFYAKCYESSNPSGCDHSIVDSVTVVIDDPGAPNSISTIPGNSQVCSGDNIQLTGSCNTGSLKWFNNPLGTGSPLFTGSPYVINTTAPGNYTVYALCESSGGCLGTSSDSVTYTVNSIPTSPTSPTATPSMICNGSSSLLTASGCTNGVVLWYDNASGTGTPIDTNSATVSPTTNTIYYAYCDINGSCRSVIGSSVTVSVFDSPTDPTNVMATPDSGCAPLSTTLSGNCATGVIEYYITPGGTGGGVGSSPTISSTTTFYAKCYNASNPSGCQYSNSVSVTVNVNTAPVDPVSVSTDKDTICPTESATLTATGCTIFEWYNNPTGTGTPIATNSGTLNVSPSSTSSYYVFCEDNGCLSVGYRSVDVIVDSCQTTSIGDFDEISVKYYPNPFNENISLEIDLLSENKFSVEVLNVQGKVVKVFSNIQSGINSLSIDNLERGVYLFYLKDKNGVVKNSTKLTKQ